MTLYAAPICLGCVHFKEFVPPTPEERQAEAEREQMGFDDVPVMHGVCDVFPDRIPAEIILSSRDHRKPFTGDHGIRFEPKTEEDAQYPDLLFSFTKH